MQTQTPTTQTFTQLMNSLLNVVEMAQKRGTFSLQESSAIFHTIQLLNANPDVQALLKKDTEEKVEEKVEEM